MFIPRKISKQKFLFSEEYREGVNDAMEEFLLFQKILLEGERENKCEMLHDKMVDLAHSLAEEFNIELDWNSEWDIIYRIIYHVFTYSINQFGYIRGIKNNLNRELIDRNERNGVNLKTRFDVFKRDCFKCILCGTSPSNEPNVILVIDHIQPLSKGGKNCLSNYQTLCQYCNAGKAARY